MTRLSHFCLGFLAFLTITIGFGLSIYKPPQSVITEILDTLEHVEKSVGITHLINEREVFCLAENIFFEAGNQPDIGKVAVGFVTINRLFSVYFPNSICGIVYQRVGTACQFSWVCQKARIIKRKEKDEDMWLRSVAIARLVVETYHQDDDPTDGALFFHANYVRPKWSKKYIMTTKINDHLFYRPDNGF